MASAQDKYVLKEDVVAKFPGSSHTYSFVSPPVIQDLIIIFESDLLN
jgi:hypothetical protein